MEQRFVRTWKRLEAEADRGEGLPAALRRSDTRSLVAALAGAGAMDPLAANVITTELLNRLNRAPFLGASLVSATMLLMLVTLEWVFTGTPFVVEEESLRAYALMGASGAIMVFSALNYAMWRGMFPRLRMRILVRAKARDY